MLVRIRMATSMASPYKSINLGRKFIRISCLGKKLLWRESWREYLCVYLLSFQRFWTLSIERFWFLFWSILNGVTLKTSNLFYQALSANHTICRIILAFWLLLMIFWRTNVLLTSLAFFVPLLHKVSTSYVAVCLFNNRSQRTSTCGRNITPRPH